ncbi:MAG: hypothetical protein IJ060_03305 [Oscillospiraceae bacterium]|nr:hypothetical protein [Oscillospiraceae bacterium]
MFRSSAVLLSAAIILMLTGCGKKEQSAAGQMTEIIPAETTAGTEASAQTTVQTPAVSSEQSETQRTGRTETTTAYERTTAESSATGTEPTELPPEDVTGLPVSSESVSSVTTAAPEPVRVVFSVEEITEAAGIPLNEMLSGALDVEDTEADAGTVMVSREKPRVEQDQLLPDWLYRVTEITVSGIAEGQTVTVTGTAIDYEYEQGTEPDEWYIARKEPFSITKTAGT